MEEALAQAEPADFVVRRGHEGPQIVISWGASESVVGASSFILVRRLFGFPMDETDGLVISTTAPGPLSQSDRAVIHCKCYFYKLFIVLAGGEVVSSSRVQGEVVALETGFYARKMFSLLPSFDQRRDRESPDQLALVETADPVTAEVFNIGEDGTEPRGPLERLFRIIGPAFDEAKGLIDCVPDQIDVDEACLTPLAGLARLLGLELNRELDPRRMREDVRNQVAYLKLKGTIPGLQARLRAVSGIDPVIDEHCDDLLISNDPSTTSPTFTLAEVESIGGPLDALFRSVGFSAGIPPFWLWFTVFMDIPEDFVLTESLATKFCIALRESSPMGHRGFLTIRTVDDEDEVATTFTDSTTDAIGLPEDLDTISSSFTESVTDEQVANAAKWLITNDEAKLTNTPDWTAVVAGLTLP